VHFSPLSGYFFPGADNDLVQLQQALAYWAGKNKFISSVSVIAVGDADADSRVAAAERQVCICRCDIQAGFQSQVC
jgi:hypothetical protein